MLNPLGWTRTDAADLVWNGSTDIHVRDVATGQDVPHQFVTLSGARYLRVLAANVPSAGYKVFEILPGTGTAPADEAAKISPGDRSTLENDAVKLVIEKDGAIRSFINKQSGNMDLAANLDGLKLNDLAAGSDAGEELRIENRGPVSVTMRARSDAGLDHTTAITLYRGSDRVDICNEMNANFNDVRY